MSVEHTESPRATVLVAEDDADLARSIATLLAPLYRVLIAPNGIVALELAAQHQPDMLISDVAMPGMDGLELTRRFRELPGNRLAPILLLSALSNLSERLAGFEAGALDYMVKPFDPSELVAKVQSQLNIRSLALRLSQSEKLAALGTLSAGLAHEMRNPANALVNAIEPLKNLLPQELLDPEKPVGQLLEVLEESSNQIALLSRQLLGFKRPTELERHPEEFPRLWNRTLAIARPILVRRDVKIDVQYGGSLHCAGSLLIQVFTNLIENAAHAAGEKGWVAVTAKQQGESLVVEVQDSGPGVPREIRERIFEPFFTTKPPGQGTGLGLSTARTIVERHGGVLDVREIEGRSTFHVELPLEVAS